MKIVVFSGAGLSKESGIPTFRDCVDGLWENFKIEEVATPDGWKKDKKKVLDFYSARWNNIKACEPNAAHKAFARLEEKHEVIHITQNIDDLLERSGCKNVWHLHGQIDRRKCEWHHDIVAPHIAALSIKNSPPGFVCDYSTKHDAPVKEGEMCPKCGGHLRPEVVWFDEMVDLQEDKIQNLVDTADIFIGVGTSAQVYPAANFLYWFKGTPIKFFIDPHAEFSRLKSFSVVTASAGEAVPDLVEEILK